MQHSQSLIINPAGGNEPIILGARIGLALNAELTKHNAAPLNIIIPISNDRQRVILQDELDGLDGTDRILVDEQAGAILQDVWRSQADFAAHVRVLHEEYDTLQRALNTRYGPQAKQLLEVRNLKGQTTTISPATIAGSLDTGGRITFDTPQQHFAFPVLMSDLIQATREANISSLNNERMRAVESRSRQEEQRYRKRFIPLVHTLAARELSEDPTLPMAQKFKELIAQSITSPASGRTYTPPLKHVSAPQEFAAVSRKGIYVMLTGYTLFQSTAQDVVDILRVIMDAANDAGLQVYMNPWAKEVEGAIRVSPKVIADPRIQAVVGRAGWGTGWQMLNAGKPWLVIPAQEGDDPEILFNHQVIQRLGIGAVIDPHTFSPQELEDELASYGPRVQELRELTTQHFGTSDGIQYLAQQLVEDYLGTVYGSYS